MTDPDPLARFVVGPTYHHIFRDYPLADIPTIPAGWSDVSWANDACPCWRVDSQGETLYVFADYADENKREWGPGVGRYSVSVETDDGPITVADSDDWAELLTLLSAPRMPVSLSGDVSIGDAPTTGWAYALAGAYYDAHEIGRLGWRLGAVERGQWVDDDKQTVDGWIVALAPNSIEETL